MLRASAELLEVEATKLMSQRSPVRMSQRGEGRVAGSEVSSCVQVTPVTSRWCRRTLGQWAWGWPPQRGVWASGWFLLVQGGVVSVLSALSVSCFPGRAGDQEGGLWWNLGRTWECWFW